MTATRLNQLSLRVVIAASAMAFAISSYLGITSIINGSLPGCGPGGGCADVMGSSYAYWFGVPVTFFAAVTHGAILTTAIFLSYSRRPRLIRMAWRIATAAAWTVLAATAWFVALMILQIRAYCIYCTAIHVLGLIVAATLLNLNRYERRQWIVHEYVGPRAGLAIYPAIGFVSILLLAISQVYWPTATYEVVAATWPSPAHQHAEPHPGAPREEDRDRDTQSGTHLVKSGAPYDMVFAGRRRITPPMTDESIYLDQWPILGSPDAEHILLFFGDYTCPQCQRMHAQILTAIRHFQPRISVVFVVVPLNAKCNPTLRDVPMPETYAKACEYARLSLAIHYADTQAFAEWDKRMADYGITPPLGETLNWAIELVGESALANAMRDSRIDEQIRRNVDIFEKLPRKKNLLPVVVLEGHYIEGVAEHAGQFVATLEQQLKTASGQATPSPEHSHAEHP